MQRRTLEWFEILARGLVWAAGVVLVLSLIGAVGIASSDAALPLLEDVQREGRTIAALGAVGGGVAAAGVLSGLGAILALLVTDRLERMPPEPEDDPQRTTTVDQPPGPPA